MFKGSAQRTERGNCSGRQTLEEQLSRDDRKDKKGVRTQIETGRKNINKKCIRKIFIDETAATNKICWNHRSNVWENTP